MLARAARIRSSSPEPWAPSVNSTNSVAASRYGASRIASHGASDARRGVSVATRARTSIVSCRCASATPNSITSVPK